jgi:hypothetical protein
MGAFLALLNPITSIIDKILPDKAANDAAKAQLLSMQLSGDIQAQIAQIDVDKQEAASQSIFVAGWRPFVGWSCGFAFVYAFIVQPFAQSVAVFAHSNFDPSKLPQLNLTEMMPVLLGMLGLGAMRSFDKANGNGNGH